MKGPRATLILCAVLASGIFLLDVVLFPGSSVGVLYSVPVALGSRWRSRRARAVLTAVTLSLLGAGGVSLGEFGPTEHVFNRLIAFAGILGTAWLAPRVRRRLGREAKDRRRAEDALAEAGAMLSALRCIFIGVDRRGVIQRWEKRAEDAFGLAAEHALGRPIDQCGVEWADEGRALRAFFEGGGADLRCELAFLGPTGEVRQVGFTISAVDRREGGYILIGQDITERLEREAEHRRLVTAVEQVDETIVITDRDGRVIYVNQAFERVTGYSREEILDAPVSTLKSGRHEDAFYAELWDTLNRGEVWTGRFTNRKKDGTLFTEDATISPVRDDAGQVTNFVAVKRDVTAELRREAQLQATQKLESIGQLASGIAHEINTPTQYISDNTRFLRDAFAKLTPLIELCSRVSDPESAPAADEVVRELIALADRAGLEFLTEEVPGALEESLTGLQRVAEIVSAMKSYAHPGSGEKEPVALNELLKRSVTLCRNEWKYVAEVECEFDESLPPVPCMPGELGQVIVNLLVNAAHAIEEKRQGDGEKGTIHISTLNAGDRVLIRVKDSGCGMPDEVRARIFEPFFTTKEVGRGTGQGLAIAHAAICDKQGGTIEVSSVPGEGTEFLIGLPLEGALEVGASG